jgi:hypothetical protein
MLVEQVDEVAAAFAPSGLKQAESRSEGDWAAMLLRRG